MDFFKRKGIFFWLLIPVVVIAAWLLYNQLHKPGFTEEDTYAGSMECIDCHEKFYQLWAPSHHGLAMQTIDSGFLSTNFPEIDMEAIMVDSSWFHVEIGGNTMKFIGIKEDIQHSYPAVYALGGKNVFYFLTPFERGRLQVLPLAYDINREEWYNNPKSALRGFTMEEDEVLPWKHMGFTFNTSCFSCHVSQLTNNFDLGTNTYDTDWRENGINCETCHGPSLEHIKVCREAGEGNLPKDLKIIRTTVFNSEQHNSSCGSCHSKMRPVTPSYIPGEKFFDHFDLVTLENQDFYPDGRDLGENYTYTTWLQSDCVIKGELDCIHCHTSSGRYRFAGESPNDACLPCHASVVSQAEAHTHHPAEAEGSRCVDCHMPMTEFARMHRSDHSMRPPSPLASEAFGSPNACILCHEEKSNDWAQEKLSAWGKSGHQEEILRNGQLVKEAREGKWENLDRMLSGLEEDEFDEVFATSLIRLLRSAGSDKKWPSFFKLMTHRSPLVRSAVATGLADLQTGESVENLLRLCRDDFRLVRIAAAQSLSSMPEALTEGVRDAAYFTALNEYIKSITARPDDWASHATLGNFYFNREDYDQAISHYTHSTALFPENVGAYVNCGFVYTLQGNLNRAEQQFKKALAYEPDNEGANLNYALLLGEMGRLEEAADVYKKVLAINPESAVAAYNISVILSSTDVKSAIGYAHKAVKSEPENPKYAYTLGYFLFQDGQYQKAEGLLVNTVDRFSSFGDAYMLLYEIYQRTESQAKAEALAERAVNNPALHESYRMRFSQLRNGSR